MNRWLLITLLMLGAVVDARGEERAYTQEVAITFANPAAAEAATLTPLPVFDGHAWALSARWDDNHPGNLTMHQVMSKHGLKGTFYLNESRAKFDQAYVEKLLAGGFSIGGHTQSHPKLNQISPGELFYEVLANRVQRESQGNLPVVSFAFPFGIYQDSKDTDAIVRITETLRRSGMYHEPYLTFVKDNPHVKPGEFVTSLQVAPGDHTVDAETFNTRLEKIFKVPKAYQNFSYNITLATHARQTGAEWDKLDKLFGELKTRADWWFCNQNEYAAYEKQVKATKIERIGVSGATATFRLTRPLPAELGATVPLTVEASADVVEVTGGHNHRGKLVNLAHPADQALPAVIDAIDNPKNAPTPAGVSKELPGVTAWLHAGDDGKLSLTLGGELSDVRLTWRLPLAIADGVRRVDLGNVSGHRVETLAVGPVSGGAYYVAEIDFRHQGKQARLFATTTVGDVIPEKPAPAPATSPAADMTPFVIPQVVNPKSVIAYRGEPIQHRMAVKDAHFYAGDQRFRAWGVNLCGGACFPDKSRAERMAARLEAAGVNTVRLHHMDLEWAKFPESIWDPNEHTEFSEEALNRLDYFVDQLAKRGIYVNLNLHVSRTHSKHLGLPDSKATGNYDKLVDLFTPQLIDAQKGYARKLLRRTNKYRNTTYAADPAIAWVEINNENSLFMFGAATKLKEMDPFYAAILRLRFNEWLAKKYGSPDKLAAAWNPPEQPNAAADVSLPPFTVTANGGAKATASAGRIDVQTSGTVAWNVEYRATPLPIAAERVYTLTFRAKADAARHAVVRVGLAKAPYTILGLRQNLQLGATWRDFRYAFRSNTATDDASLSFQLGGSSIDVEIADVKLTSQPLVGLSEGESLGTVAFNLEAESRPRLLDRLRFMAELEKAYYDDFRNFLKTDLACQSLITGSMAYGPLGLWAQADMDFIDTHAYWQHPTFVGGWNATRWTLDQKAMTDSPQVNKLMEIAATRLMGKPFTVSEYNHPAPLDAQAETVPMIAATAAAQDWDGVWLFCYASSSKESDGAFTGWFDMESNPAKWAFMPAGTAIYRDAAVAPLAKATTYRVEDPFALHTRHPDTVMGGLIAEQQFTGDVLTAGRVYVAYGSGTATDLPDAGTSVTWQPGRFHVKGRSAEVIADTKGGLRTDGKGFAVLTRTEVPAGELFTVAGRVENSGMGFSADRRTVTNQWGVAPTLIEKLPIKLAAPKDERPVPLNPDGTISTDAQSTMWFLSRSTP